MSEVTNAWRFRCFYSERGEDLIDRWISKNLSRKARAKLERTLELLCVRPATEWGRPNASPLGNHIYVIRFSDENNRKIRIAGHFQGDTKYFVLTQPVIEKDSTYEPDNYEQLAADHKNVCSNAFNSRTQDCFYLDIHRREDQRTAIARPNHGHWLH